MNTTPLTTIAPEIFRKRLLVEGYFTTDVDEEKLREYFLRITSDLGFQRMVIRSFMALPAQAKISMKASTDLCL